MQSVFSCKIFVIGIENNLSSKLTLYDDFDSLSKEVQTMQVYKMSKSTECVTDLD